METNDPATWKDYLTVGRLKEEISKYPDDTPVFVEQDDRKADRIKKIQNLDVVYEYARAWCVCHYGADASKLFIDVNY